MLSSILLFAAIWSASFIWQYDNEFKDRLKTLRVSMISPQGEVYFDNMADESTLESHLDRPEVNDALLNGSGHSQRFSDTMDETIYYYAVKMDDGNILRLAIVADSFMSLFYNFIPILIISLILAAALVFVVVKRMTTRLVAPINNINIDSPDLDTYEELLPFFKKIELQKQEISSQLKQIEDVTATTTAITENMTEGILLMDNSGRVLLANRSVKEILDTENPEGQYLIQVYRDADFLEQSRACLKGEKSELVADLNDGVYRIFFSPVLEDDRANGAVILFIDITERYAAEAQRKEFSANVSHEMKTPLTTITALSEMIADGTVKSQDVRPFADKIKKQSGRLLNIIDDIIKLSEFDEGEADKNFEDFNLRELAETVAAALKEKAAEKHVTVSITGDVSIVANRLMIDELLYNLLDNAIKYNRDGGKVSILLDRDPEYTVISIKDTGIGIPKSHLDHIFERFYRVDKSRSKKTGGTGLGLSIVKHVAEFHGGNVKADSIDWVGTTFTVKIPHKI